MRKILITLLLFAAMFSNAQYVSTLRKANETTEFGIPIPQGMQIFNTYNNELYVAKYAISASATLVSAADSVKLIIDYDRLTDNYLSMFQGVRWNATDNTYQRTGSLIDIAVSQSAGNAELPIQSEMKRCVLNDLGIVQYYIDPANPHFKNGESTPTSSGTTTSTSSDELVDSGADFVNDGVVEGMIVKNTTDDTYAGIKEVAATTLTIASDIFESGEDYEIGTANYGGTDGQVMVQIPKFYYRQEFTIDGDRYWSVSLYHLPGFKLHPAYFKDNQEVNYRYYSAFEGSLWDASTGDYVASGDIAVNMYATGDKLASVANQWAKTNEQRSEYREASVSRGEGWRLLDFTLNSAVQLLYLVEYANFNAQGMIGMGRTELSDGTWTADSYIGKSGLSIGDGNSSNSVSNGGTAGYLTDYMTFRGIENWYGNIWKMLGGITWDGRWTGAAAAQPIYYTNNAADFKGYGTDYMYYLTDASYIGTSAGYISDIENTFSFIPKSVGGSYLIYDVYWQLSEVGRDYWRVFLFGGDAHYGGAAGGFAVAVPDAWSTGAVYVAGRLAY